jgi:hypothetical protein
MLGVTSLNLCRETANLTGDFLAFPQFLQACAAIYLKTLNWATVASLHIHCNSLFCIQLFDLYS